MKRLTAVLLLTITAIVLLTSCAAFKRAINYPPGTTNQPPAVVTLQEISQVARAAAPGPVGESIGIILGGLAAVISGYAAFHARNAAIQTTPTQITNAAKDAIKSPFTT